MEPYVIIDGEAYWNDSILTVSDDEWQELIALTEAEEAKYGISAN